MSPPAPPSPPSLQGPRPQRASCPRCALPLRSCLCRWVTPTANELPVLLLQHPQEATQAKGSARLLRLSLRHCSVWVGERFDAAALGLVLDGPAGLGSLDGLGGLDGQDSQGAVTRRPSAARPWLLFPTKPGAVPSPPPAAGAATAAAGPTHLLLLDGTWRQARRLLQANPWLQALPRWPLPDPAPSRYTIRRAARSEQRSTLEAACAALTLLEAAPGRYDALLAAMDGWVAERTAWAAGKRASA